MIQDIKEFDIHFWGVCIRDEIELDSVIRCILESYVGHSIVINREDVVAHRYSVISKPKDEVITILLSYIGIECSFTIPFRGEAWNYDKLNNPLGG